MLLSGFFKKSVSRKKEEGTKHQADRELAEHRYDEDNFQLGSQSISMADGHAGTNVTYYAALRQVVVHSYCTRSHGKSTDTVERIPIPEDMASRHSRSEILEYAKEKNSTVSAVCR